MNKGNLASLSASLLLILGLCLALIRTTAQAANIPSDTSFGIWDAATNTYTLTQDLTEGIVIDGSNFTLDGAGHTITGTGSGNGVLLDQRTGVTIKNLTVQSFATGIYLEYSIGNTLKDNTASGNGYGIYLYLSSDNTLQGNTASGNGYGIYLYLSSDNNTLEGNSASNNSTYGIRLYSSDDNTIYNNYFNNTTNFDFYTTIPANTWNTTKTPGTNIVGGPYLGGNFWAKPTNDGFSQTNPDTDGDGICNLVYDLATGNVDNLPLAPWPPQVVSVTLNPARAR